MRMQLTRVFAFRARIDAGNRAMSSARCTVWAEEDAVSAAREFDRIWPRCPGRFEPEECLCVNPSGIFPSVCSLGALDKKPCEASTNNAPQLHASRSASSTTTSTNSSRLADYPTPAAKPSSRCSAKDTTRDASTAGSRAATTAANENERRQPAKPPRAKKLKSPQRLFWRDLFRDRINYSPQLCFWKGWQRVRNKRFKGLPKTVCLCVSPCFAFALKRGT